MKSKFAMVIGFATTALASCSTPERLDGPNWAGARERPYEQAYTPQRAVKQHVAGLVVLQCQVGPEQSLSACSVLHETPQGWGFGEAAIRMREGFRITQRGDTPYRPEPGAFIVMPIYFCPPHRKLACEAELKAAASAFLERSGLEPVP